MRAGILKQSVLYLAGAAMVGTLALAQEGGMPSASQQSAPVNNTVPMAENGVPPSMANYKASSFLKNTFENDQAQIQMSQLAAQKAQSDDVKQFGEQMVNVHTKLDEQLTPMAKQLGVSQAKGPAKKDKKEVEKLQSLSGPDFENEYLRAMSDQQQRSKKLFDDETKDTASPAAQQTAKADVPVLEQNYQVLQKIAQAHNVTLESQAGK